MMESEPDILVGQVLAGRYEVMRKLNEGGMGAVYLAVQHPLERPVALKVLLQKHRSDSVAVRRFEKEALAVSRLMHPHVVTLYDFGTTTDGDLYIAMEYLAGKSLREIVDDTGPLPWQRALHIMQGVTAALISAHGAGIVHRDLKPENIMLVDHGGDADFAKVLDFGLARSMALEEPGKQITQRDVIPGTPLYMSPERATGISNDPRSDLYALGAVLFELLTGQPPFNDDTAIKIILRHLHEPPKAPSTMGAKVPRAVDDLVLQLLQKQPDLRPPSARALQETLTSLLRPSAWEIARGRDVSRRAGLDTELGAFAAEASTLEELRFSLERPQVSSEESTAAPLPLITRKKAPTDPLVTQEAEGDDPMPLLTRKRTSSPHRVSSIAEAATLLANARSPREVADVAVQFLLTRFARAFVVDLRELPVQILAAGGFVVAERFALVVGGNNTLRQIVVRREAFFGAPPLTPDWLALGNALGGSGALVFVGGLVADGAPSWLFYADSLDATPTGDVKDLLVLLREAAGALSQ